MRFARTWFAVVGLVVSYHLDARPVSYPGGWTAILENTGDFNALNTHYSPTKDYSLGGRVEYRRDVDYWLNTFQFNQLVKRWNRRDSQANFWLESGVGLATQYGKRLDTRLAGFTGLALDWENRRYFLAYRNRFIEAGSIDDRYIQQFRAGYAPYIGEFGDLHTWLMVNVKHEPEARHEVIVTPLVRFLKNVHLIEVGVNSQQKLLFNWIIRF